MTSLPHKKGGLLTHAVLSSTLLFIPLCAADTVINGTVLVTQQTSIKGNIDITPTGQINTRPINGDGITIDSPNAHIVLDPGNIHPAAISSQFNGIHIVPAGNNATISIGAGTTIDAGTIGIFVQGKNAKITNAGSLLGTLGANDGIITLADNTTIINQTGASIQSNNGPAIDAQGKGFSLTNAGTISVINSYGVEVLADFTTITNQSGGTISGSGGFGAINIRLPVTGDIQNAGVIADGGGTQTIIIGANYNGSINNLSGGIIQSTTGPAATAIYIDGNFIEINNAGIIQSLNSNETIFATAGKVGTIVNTGTISNNPVNNVFDLQSGGGGINIPIIQNGGFIIGNLLTASLGGNVLTINDGEIDGIVQTANGVVNLLTLVGGKILQNIQLGDQGDTVLLIGTAVQNILGNAVMGNDTINIFGGSFAAINGQAGVDTLNIYASFTATGPIDNMDNININNANTVFTLNNTITNMNALLTVNPNTALIANANISGAGNINNLGQITISGIGGGRIFNLAPAGNMTDLPGSTLLINDDATLTLTGNNFTHQAGAVFVPTLASPATYGKLVTNIAGNQVLFKNNSYIEPVINGFIPDGSTYNIVTQNIGTITDQSTLINTSAIVHFNKNLINANQILQLKAQRLPYSTYASTIVTQGIAGLLNTFAMGAGPTQPGLRDLLVQLDTLQAPQDLEPALESLTPPFNYGLVAGSYGAMDRVFEGISERSQLFHRHHRYRHKMPQGVNLGDFMSCLSPAAPWIKGMGSHAEQQTRNNVRGYKANLGGAALGVDWAVSDCAFFGLAGSYTRVEIKDKNLAPKDEAINYLQGTVYGGIELACGFYLDGLLGLGRDNIKINRTIRVNQINTFATAFTQGTQVGAQSDLGWSWIEDEAYYVSPFTRLKYLGLNVNDYSEVNGGDLNLSVQNNTVSDFQGGVGLKAGAILGYRQHVWIPAELTVLLGYDFKHDAEQSIANFVVEGPAFITQGITPGPALVDIGLVLNAVSRDGSNVNFAYHAQIRDGFMSHAGSLQYAYFWG